MEGRQAVINVLTGVAIGLSIPFIIAWMLSVTYADFRWLDHLFTILMFSILCAVVGVLVNLPWSGGSGSSSGSHRTRQREYAHSHSHSASRRERVRVTESREKVEEPRQESKPITPPKHYAMSRVEALRAFGLPYDATDDEVRDAYRRLAKEHHPDHVASQGEEAVAEATQKFVRIREAYEVLVDET